MQAKPGILAGLLAPPLLAHLLPAPPQGRIAGDSGWRGTGLDGPAFARFAGWAAVLITARLGLAALLARGRLAGAMCQWDCHWYVIVTRFGYDPIWRLMRGHWQPDWAFFPLLPLLMRGVGALTGAQPAAAGIVVSAAALWVFVLAGWAWRARTRAGATPWPWLLVVLAWPYGVYFQAPYTESLFAALVCLCLLAAIDGRPWMAAGASALLTATRPNAVLIAAWFGLRCLSGAWRARTPKDALRNLLPALLAPLGLLAFMAWLWFKLGDPLAFVHAQAAWGHGLRNPFAVMADPLRVAAGGHAHAGLLYNAGWALAGLTLGVVLLVKGRRTEAWLCAGTAILALLSGSLWSMPRYMAGSPVVLFAAADVFDELQTQAARTVFLLAGLAMHIVLLLAWFREAAFLV